MSNRPIKENSFEPAGGGVAGAVSSQPGAWGATPAGPNQSQDPDHFQSSNNNKSRNPKSGVTKKDLDQLYANPLTAPDPDDIIAGMKFEGGQQIVKNKEAVEKIVVANLKKNPRYYRDLDQLNITDAGMVKNMTENTYTNAGIDTQVYNKLQELKVFKTTDYAKLRLMQEQLTNSLIRLANSGKIFFDGTTATAKTISEARHPNDSSERPKVTPNIEETKKIFADMARGYDKKYVVNSQICDVMKEMWAAKLHRSQWKVEPKS